MDGFVVIAIEEKYVAVFLEDSGHKWKLAEHLLSRNEAILSWRLLSELPQPGVVQEESPWKSRLLCLPGTQTNANLHQTVDGSATVKQGE